MVAAWVAAAKTPPGRVFAAGPARTIWTQRFGEAAVLDSDPEQLGGIACLVSGTGWASDFEHRARIAAAKAGLRSIAVVDHWVNYAMRFERAGQVQLPDAIWVGDKDALRIARASFQATPIERHPNLYAHEQARGAGQVCADGDALFLLEPARSDWGQSLPGEFQALDFFMARRVLAGVPARTAIRIRPHPSDPPGKYADWIAQHREARIDASPDMATALRPARWVIGLNSAGLALALEAGRTVISALPPHAPPLVLPHEGIIRLADI